MVRQRQVFMPSKSKVSQVLLGGAVFPLTHSVTNSLYVLTSLGLGLKTGVFTNNFVKSIYHLYYFLFYVEQNNDQELFRDPFRSLRQNIANWKTYERHKQTKTVFSFFWSLKGSRWRCRQILCLLRTFLPTDSLCSLWPLTWEESGEPLALLWRRY